MLRLESIQFAFEKTPVFCGLDLEVSAGEFIALIGRSGCGKTTILRIASGLLRPDLGSVSNTFARTTFVFQEPRLLPWASALDNAAFGLKALGVSEEERRGRAAEILSRFGLSRKEMERRPAELSGGMAQRVAIARALATKPELVLMDEPFGSLDVGLRQDMQDLLRTEVERTKLTVLFVTHDVPEVVRLADRIVVLSPAPARVVADLRNVPTRGLAETYEAAARLLQRPEIASALTVEFSCASQR